MSNIREIVLSILMEYDRDGKKKPSLLKDALEKYDYLETRDKAFIKRVVDGCLERQIQVDYVIDQFSKTKVLKMQPLIRNIIRMGTYQIMFMDQVPDSAACNEAVKLASKHKFDGLKGFVNGVLRNIARNKDNIKYPDKNGNSNIEYLSVFYSMPQWLCKMWVQDYGFEKTEKILQFFLEARPTVLRINMYEAKDKEIQKKIKDELVEEIKKTGAQVKDNNLLSYAIELEKTDNIKFLPGFDEGRFAVQDVSSMLVAEIAGVTEGQTVVDVCAAPGGKTTHAAEKVGKSGRVLSRDVSDRKCELILENAERLGLDNIEVKVSDARIHDGNLGDMADVLYLDVPCSGLGIIGRKSDIKLNTSQKALSEIEALQWEIVKASWDYVKKGGTMIYSTCTVNKAENQKVVEKICREFPFEMVDISEVVSDIFKPEKDSDILKSAKKGYIQLLPGEYGTDGFFIARLRRKSD